VSARAYRVSPRRLPGGRPTRIVLVLVFFAILFSYISPVANFVDAWRGSHDTEAQLGELRREHDHLASKAASLEDPNAAVKEARKLGMVLPGERSYVVKSLPR
jgi:cell division protein FtsB